MNRFFMGCLALAALAMMVGQAIAGSGNSAANATQAAANNAADNGGAVIIETYTASAVAVPANNNDMQPLPGNPGVEVAPVDSSNQPVVVEEDMLIQQTEDSD